MKSALEFIGPLSQIITLAGLPMRGPLNDSSLDVIHDGGILFQNGRILKVGNFTSIRRELQSQEYTFHHIDFPAVVFPGFIDSHTHICYAGSRAKDFAMRNAGSSYLEIARAGGGIWDTVTKTRQAESKLLNIGIVERANTLLHRGVTTIEVKSGYGLSVSDELKMLQAIQETNNELGADLVPTCLAAHIFPRDFDGSKEEYLELIMTELFPVIKEKNLASRIDAFVEEGAFSPAEISSYLTEASNHGFDITIHADQFSTGGSKVAVDHKAVSADHLEASMDHEIQLLAQSETVATVLPGASVGLGMNFAPARKILDANGILAIASDWNPGSAPMGDLLTLSSILSTYEKLTTAEVLAGITFRAAQALRLDDRGVLSEGKLANFILFPTSDYREVLYHQCQLQPAEVWKKGKPVKRKS